MLLLNFVSELAGFFEDGERIECSFEGRPSFALGIITESRVSWRWESPDDVKPVIQRCDRILSLLETRISKLNKAFTALKLECVGLG